MKNQYTNSVVEGKVRVFQKSIKRKLKDGDNVVILKLEDYNKLYENSKISKSTIKELNNVECYNNLQKTNEDLINEINRLRNKHDHLQERLRTSLEEINKHQKVINDLFNRGFLDYILGRQPESIKMLETVKDEHKKPNIPDTKREW
jgi:chaperonin cofactor prefoldin